MDVKNAAKTFYRSGEMDAVWGAGGAGAAVISLPYTVPYLSKIPYIGKYSTAIVGAGLIVLGAWVKHDGLGKALVGAGVIYFVDGLVRIFIPSVANSTTFAAETEINMILPTASGYTGM